MLPTLSQQIAVESIGTDYFVSKTIPQRTGNALPIAYGGCTIAVAVHAACKTTTPKFEVYSVLGTFLGPSTIDRVLHCRINRLRDTRTFVSRHVIVFQLQDDGSERLCAQVSVDFQVSEPALLVYHTPPKKTYGTNPYDEASTVSTSEVLEKSIASGMISAAAAEQFYTDFKLVHTHFENRHCVESMSTQNAFGMARSAKTTHDDRPIHERTYAEWTRARLPLSSYEENIAALCFLLDGGLSFLPLHLNHMDFDDSSACSTLDFALRIVTPRVELKEWHLKERRTIAGSGGRTWSEQTLWAEAGDVVATMSQTSILRPKTTNSVAFGAKI